MPALVRLYIVNALIGLGLAVLFVAALLALDVAHLRHLVLGSDMGWLAGFMLVAFHGLVFAGVQFAIAVMRLADDEGGPRGGSRQMVLVPIPVETRRHPARRR